MDRIEKLEKDVRVTQDSVLLIHKDLEQMSKAMVKIADNMEVMTTIQTNQKVMEERCESRHNQLREADRVLHARVDTVNAAIKEIVTQDTSTKKAADRGSTAFTILVWAGGILGTLIITTAFGTMLWAIKAGGA